MPSVSAPPARTRAMPAPVSAVSGHYHTQRARKPRSGPPSRVLVCWTLWPIVAKATISSRMLRLSGVPLPILPKGPRAHSTAENMSSHAAHTGAHTGTPRADRGAPAADDRWEPGGRRCAPLRPIWCRRRAAQPPPRRCTPHHPPSDSVLISDLGGQPKWNPLQLYLDSFPIQA